MIKRLCLLFTSFVFAFTCLAQTPGSMNIGAIQSTNWPSPSPTIMRPRLGAEWRQIETARGTYLWTTMDAWTAAAKENNAQTLFTFVQVPSWASTDTTTMPSDLNETNETCQGVLNGVVRPDGNCIFAEYVTALMQHECGVTSQPATPLTGGACKIRIYEAWNEFNDGQFWSSNYTDMAKTANDAAQIVRLYCGNCTFLAGNVSAGGDGYNATYYGDPNNSGIFDVALGQMLDAWYAIPGASLPDGVSYHAYGARRNIIPYPMPETTVSQGDALCAANVVPNPNCRMPIFQQTGAVKTMLLERSWAANLPIWVTEGGFGRNDDMTDNVSQTDYNTTFLRQAYVARWMLAMASTGSFTNLWYEYDDQCWGTMMGNGEAPTANTCPGDPAVPKGFTPIHQTWVQMLSYLDGISFNGPCTGSGTVWSCFVTKSGAPEEFMWTTAWLSTSSQAVSSEYGKYMDLAGTEHTISGNIVTLSNQPILLMPGSGSGSPLTVSPATSTVVEGATQQFKASVTTATWTTTCGTITSSGVFKAPLYPSTTCIVTAKSGSESAKAAVTVSSPITMTPISASTPQGKTQKFSASKSVTWSASCGSITSSGVYLASGTVGAHCTIEGIATTSPKYTVYGYDKITQ